MIVANVTGLEALQEALTNLEPKLQRKSIKDAILAAAQPIIEDAKAKAPVLQVPTPERYPGELRDSINVSVKSKKNFISARIGPERVKGDSNQTPATYGLVMEFGGKHWRKQPYMRPAFDAKNGAALDTFVATLTTEVEKLAVSK